MTLSAAAAIVNGAYREILRREPDEDGAACFIKALSTGALSPAGLISELYHSPERQSLAAAPAIAPEQPEAPSPPASHPAEEAPAPVLEPAVEAAPRAAVQDLPLDQHYSADPAAWDAFLGPLFDRTLHSRSDRRPPAFARLQLVLDIAHPDVEAFARSLHALDALAAAAPFGVSIALVWRGAGPLPAPLAERLRQSRVGATVHTSRTEAKAGWNADDLVLWLQSGDAPRPEFGPALATYVEARTALATWDSYFVDAGRIHPMLHPGANPTLAMNVDSVFSRFACRAAVLDRIDLGEDDLIEGLRAWLETAPPSELWTHIPLPLVQLEIGREVLAKRREAAIAQTGPCKTRRQGRDLSSARVTMVICTKDKGHLLLQLVQGVLRAQADRVAEIVIVSNNTSNRYAKQTLAELGALPKVKVLEYNQPFNFSAQSNLGAREGAGDYILMLNDDVAPITADWLDQLLSPFADPDVGVAAPLLLYPDERVQHAGMFLGFQGSAGHALRFGRLPERDYLFYASAPRDVSVVTGAVMLISRECFDALNGFDELLASYLQDVDLCLRARRSGFGIVFTPLSRLIHMESASVIDYIADHAVNENRGREHAYFARRWGSALQHDDFHNPLFLKSDESLRTLVNTG